MDKAWNINRFQHASICGNIRIPQICPSCNGTGRSVDNPNPICAQCEGRGSVYLILHKENEDG